MIPSPGSNPGLPASFTQQPPSNADDVSLMDVVN